VPLRGRILTGDLRDGDRLAEEDIAGPAASADTCE
jgi:DNA-binding GntR family transcriptional regulator